MGDAPGPPATMVDTLVGFVHVLRGRGVGAGSGETMTYLAAVDHLDPTRLEDLYWAGRTTLVTRREQLPAYEQAFRSYFLGGPDPSTDEVRTALRARAGAEGVLDVPLAERPEGDQQVEEARLGLVASDVEVLRNRPFADCTPEELSTLRRIMQQVRLAPPVRRTRRHTPAPRGRRPDLRRTVRDALRTHGDPARLHWRRRRVRPRPLVLVVDVSGSMADHSRAIVQFAHAARRASDRVEVFCFGTRLTRITPALQRRSPDEALLRAADLVVDWEGGTRIGESLATFVDRYGRRGTCRGGIVVICSDGLDRGDPALLDRSMERLARVCHRIVWLHPQAEDGVDFVPSTLGMSVAVPHVDRVLSGRDLRSLEAFAGLLPELG